MEHRDGARRSAIAVGFGRHAACYRGKSSNAIAELAGK